MIFFLAGGALGERARMGAAFQALPQATFLGLSTSSLDRHRRRRCVLRVPDPARAPGRDLYAVGGNPVAARLLRHRLGRTASCSPTHFGRRRAGSAAISGCRATASPISRSPSAIELTVIAACVIGGVSIAGGIGTVAGTLLGALFLGIVINALPVIRSRRSGRWPSPARAIILAVVINARAERRPGPRHSQAGGGAHHERTKDTHGHARHIPDRLDSPLHSALLARQPAARSSGGDLHRHRVHQQALAS